MNFRPALCSVLTAISLTCCIAQPTAIAGDTVTKNTSTKNSDVIFSDDFESYATGSAFEKVWLKDGEPNGEFDAGFGRASRHSVKLTSPQALGNGSTNRFYHDLPHPLTPTDSEPIEFSYDLFLDPAGAPDNWPGAFQSVDLRGFANGHFKDGPITNIVSLGLSWVCDDTSSYCARICTVTSQPIGQQYHALNLPPGSPKRSPGWHLLMARIGETHTTVSIDGIPAADIAVHVAGPFTTIVIGSGVNSGGQTMSCDNIRVYQEDASTSGK